MMPFLLRSISIPCLHVCFFAENLVNYVPRSNRATNRIEYSTLNSNSFNSAVSTALKKTWYQYQFYSCIEWLRMLANVSVNIFFFSNKLHFVHMILRNPFLNFCQEKKGFISFILWKQARREVRQHWFIDR